MSFKLALLDYKQMISLPDNSYKGIQETAEGWLVQDLNKGTNFGIYGSLDKALIMASAYGLNLYSPVVPEASKPAPEGTPTDGPIPTPIQHLATSPTTDPLMSFEAYCALFENPKNKSGYKFIVDKSASLGWVILKEGTSEYGRYASVEEALQDAYQHNLNLKTKKELK